MVSALHEKVFNLKLGARIAATIFLPFLTGPRDQLSYYEKKPLLTPDEDLGTFIRDVLRDKGAESKAAEVKEFLDAVMPAASTIYLARRGFSSPWGLARRGSGSRSSTATSASRTASSPTCARSGSTPRRPASPGRSAKRSRRRRSACCGPSSSPTRRPATPSSGGS